MTVKAYVARMLTGLFLTVGAGIVLFVVSATYVGDSAAWVITGATGFIGGLASAIEARRCR